MPALKENLLKYGVLSCRDLVELYYGWRMVAVVQEFAAPGGTASPQQLLGQDPRRIKYEIIMTAETGGGALVTLGTHAGLDAGLGQDYAYVDATVTVVSRSFLTDLDSVCQEVWFTNADGNSDIAVRTVILTPAPVDEIPLG